MNTWQIKAYIEEKCIVVTKDLKYMESFKFFSRFFGKDFSYFNIFRIY